jgi:hypothetical protein
MKQLVTLAAMALAGAPIYAGTVYIPVAKTDPGVEGIEYHTRVVLANTGQAARRATPHLIGLNADGTERELVESLGSVTVNPNGTAVVTDLLGGDELGLIEMVMAPQLVATAQLVSVMADGSSKIGAGWPIISDANRALAGEVVHLQGWSRSQTLSTDFGLVNLGVAASCDVDVWRIDGVQLGHWELSRPALSFALFRDVLNTIGIPNGAELRAEITCDQPFFAFAVLTDSETHEHRTVLASALGTSTLQVPGQAPPCPDGTVCFDLPGAFYTVTSALRTVAYNIDVPLNTTYSAVTVDFDFVFTGWWGSLPTGEHNLFWLNRGRYTPPIGYPIWTNNVFGYANARGPGRDRVTLVTNIDLGQNNTSFLTTNAALNPGTPYHISYVYNHAARVTELRITSNGNLVAQIIGVPTGPVSTKSNDAFMIYFGNDVGHDGFEVPWLPGTQFSNAAVRFTP